MAGYQRLIILGNLTSDAESKMVGESEVCSYSVAVNGMRDGDAEFFDCEQWKPGGVLPYLTKGTTVLCEGEIHTNKWTTKEGEKRSRKIMKVFRLQLAGGRKEKALEEEFAGDFR